LPGDSLVVSDEVMSKLAVFDPGGRIARLRRFPADQPTITPWAVFPDGSLLATTAHRAAPSPGGEAVRDTLVLLSFDPATGERTEILRKLAALRVFGPEGALPLPWTGTPVFDVDGDDIIVTAGVEHVIERWSRAGRLLERESDGREPRRVTPAMQAMHRERMMRGLADPAIAESLARYLAALPMPSTALAWDRLLVAADGRIWVRDYELDREGPALWAVFDGEAGVIARVRTPPGFEIMDITGDLLLGVASEGSGERVRAYRVER
jgi:hypothetical protein